MNNVRAHADMKNQCHAEQLRKNTSHPQRYNDGLHETTWVDIITPWASTVASLS